MSSKYKGIALPWGTTIPSVIEPKDDLAVIKSSVIWIVLTAPGERVMLPTFGSLVGTLLANPIDEAFLDQVRLSVREAIERWENRVRYVDFSARKTAANTVTCALTYEVLLDPARPTRQAAEWQVTGV